MPKFTDLKISILDNGALLVQAVDTNAKTTKEAQQMIAVPDWPSFIKWLEKEVDLLPKATLTLVSTTISDKPDVF